MPLRCLDPTGQSIYSFDVSDDEWQALELENRKSRHLTMPCCSARVTLKRSRLGTPFFAHKAVQGCETVPETEEHRYLKRLVVIAARANGWKAETEVTDVTPSGEPWRADVLAQKGKHRIAVEIQWSRQTDEVTMWRQRRYAESSVYGLWLFRQPWFPVDSGLPAVGITGSLEKGFTALVPSHSGTKKRDLKPHWHQVVPMEELLNAAFSRRFRFGIPLNNEATAGLRCSMMRCWNPSCGAQTRILTGLEIRFGPNECKLTAQELQEYPELLEVALSHLPNETQFISDPSRASLREGCPGCGTSFGSYFEQELWYSQDTVRTFSIRLSSAWCAAIAKHSSHGKWTVYPDSAS